MADFPTTNIRVNSQISPYTDDQVFPLFDSAHGLGGLRTVGTTAEMNAIFDRRRTRGMMVYVSGVSAYYALIGTTANSGWTTEFQIGTGTNILSLNNTFTGTNVFNAGVTFTTDIKVNNVNIGKGPGPSTNLIFGVDALSSNSSGQYNVAIGTAVLGVNTEGEQNIGIGYGTLLGNSSGNSNVAIGHGSATSNTTGSHNTAVGDTSLYENITGAYNTAIGTASLYNSKGDNNTALGSNSLGGIQTGSQNIAIGSDAGTSIPTGAAMTSATGGIYIGTLSKGSTQGRVNEIVIGTEAVGMGSNTAVLGATTQAAAFIYGLVHTVGGVSAPGATFSGRVNVTGLLNSTGGVSASGGITFNGVVNGATATFNRLLTASAGISAAGADSVFGGVTAQSLSSVAWVKAGQYLQSQWWQSGLCANARIDSDGVGGIDIKSPSTVTIGDLGPEYLPTVENGIRITKATNSTVEIISPNTTIGPSSIAELTVGSGGSTFAGNVYMGGTLTVQGNFTVNGSTTIINSTTIEVDDKLILLAQGTTLNTALNDGGIELGSGVGATPKSIKWINATSAWTSSEDFNLVSGKVYEINGTTVLSSSALGTGITSSSLQSVGTISSGTWQGTAVGATYGGTGRTTYTIGDILYANGTSSLTVLGASTAGRLLAANGAGAAPEYKQLLIRDADANSVATETSGAGTLTMTIQNASTSVKGLSRYDSFNFSVAAGVVGITAIDGGSYT